MISHIKGTKIHTEAKFVIVDANGVGYKVFVTSETSNILSKQTEIELWTYLAVRENALDLYGFLKKEELDFFELLITISGIGPKTAMGILNVASIKTLRQAIASSETASLTKISGIGKKVADKIVLELKDKIEFMEADLDTVGAREEADAIEGLKALGYEEREAREALKKVSKEITKPGERIKHALKILGK